MADDLGGEEAGELAGGGVGELHVGAGGAERLDDLRAVLRIADGAGDAGDDEDFLAAFWITGTSSAAGSRLAP